MPKAKTPKSQNHINSTKMSTIPVLRLSLPLPTSLHHHSSLLPPHHNHFVHHRTPPLSTTFSRKPPPPTLTKASYTPTPATDRLISAASYFLPFFNSLHYGRFLFQQYPILALPFQPLLPLLSLYRSVPYASFVSFFALYLGIVRNPSFRRYARFNALQALVLDVLLVLPMLVQKIFSPGSTGIGLKFTVWMHNFLFVFVVACFVYGLGASVLGKTPYLPFVADAAGRQLE